MRCTSAWVLGVRWFWQNSYQHDFLVILLYQHIKSRLIYPAFYKCLDDWVGRWRVVLVAVFLCWAFSLGVCCCHDMNINLSNE